MTVVIDTWLRQFFLLTKTIVFPISHVTEWIGAVTNRTAPSAHYHQVSRILAPFFDQAPDLIRQLGIVLVGHAPAALDTRKFSVYLCTLPEPSPPANFSTSETPTRL